MSTFMEDWDQHLEDLVEARREVRRLESLIRTSIAKGDMVISCSHKDCLERTVVRDWQVPEGWTLASPYIQLVDDGEIAEMFCPEHSSEPQAKE